MPFTLIFAAARRDIDGCRYAAYTLRLMLLITVLRAVSCVIRL